MFTVPVRMLQRWRVDSEDAVPSAGQEKLVIVVLKPRNQVELALACSKVDAMELGIQLQRAASDALAE